MDRHQRRQAGRITPACAGRTKCGEPDRRGAADHPRVRGENLTEGVPFRYLDGSPPRARGEHQQRITHRRRVRITPACAGRTYRRTVHGAGGWDHPRVRGENDDTHGRVQPQRGSPPRARGELGCPRLPIHLWGITPACAGRTVIPSPRTDRSPDHPRVRGENPVIVQVTVAGLGSPPRARGEHTIQRQQRRQIGITPACAGRTTGGTAGSKSGGDHPRVRGENATETKLAIATQGSPPRARGEPGRPLSRRPRPRITPACAGRTDLAMVRWWGAWDHPRVRGENAGLPFVAGKTAGSPPRARGERGRFRYPTSPSGITPACAGRTEYAVPTSQTGTDHPRVRGENVTPPDPGLVQRGSPPRARGEPRPARHGHRRRGITPACAGRTSRSAESCRSAPGHPRVRGENLEIGSSGMVFAGSPPRARGERHPVPDAARQHRITPACAGRTVVPSSAPATGTDHPRVRGENWIEQHCIVPDGGSPPRARGERTAVPDGARSDGITPACAGRTGS